MKTIKHLKVSLQIAGVLLLLFSVSCNKDIPEKLSGTALMNKRAVTKKEITPYPTYNLKIKANGHDAPRVTKALEGEKKEKLTAALKNRQQNKESHIERAYVADATLSLTAYGTSYYEGYAYTTHSGPQDYYLVNLDTGSYQLISAGVDGGSCYIIVEYPDIYNNYAVYVDGEFTNSTGLGTPYTGVSMGSGYLEFTDQATFDDLVERLENAYEAHSASFYDQYDNLTDTAVYALELSSNFDDLEPYKEFEAYFGLSSLRDQIQGEIDTWLTNLSGSYPGLNYPLTDDSETALLNTSGEAKINGTVMDVPGSWTFEEIACMPKVSDAAEETPNSLHPWFRAQESIYGHHYAKAIVKYTGYGKRYATKMKARISGIRYDGSCDEIDPFDSDWGPMKRRKKISRRKWVGSPSYYKYNHLKGEFYTNSTDYTSLVFN